MHARTTALQLLTTMAYRLAIMGSTSVSDVSHRNVCNAGCNPAWCNESQKPASQVHTRSISILYPHTVIYKQCTLIYLSTHTHSELYYKFRHSLHWCSTDDEVRLHGLRQATAPATSFNSGFSKHYHTPLTVPDTTPRREESGRMEGGGEGCHHR